MRTLTPVVATIFSGCGLVIPVALLFLSVGLRDMPRFRPAFGQEASAKSPVEPPTGVARAEFEAGQSH